MNTALVQVKEPVDIPARKASASTKTSSTAAFTLSIHKLFAVPLATLVALLIHWQVAGSEPVPDTRSYSIFLGLVFGASLAAAAVQSFSPRFRPWLAHMAPICAALFVLL